MSYPEALPHGSIQEQFVDVFTVTGTVIVNEKLQFSRNMIIARDGEELTLINTVRLSEEGLAQLDALGRVVRVVKIGSFHGMDDPFYLDRYDARFVASERMRSEELEVHERMVHGQALEFADASYFEFKSSSRSEGAILLGRARALVTCDSFQNMVQPDRFFGDGMGPVMRSMGFIGEAVIGPGWVGACSPDRGDFDELLELEFDHLIPSHGVVLRERAKSAMSRSVERLFR